LATCHLMKCCEVYKLPQRKEVWLSQPADPANLPLEVPCVAKHTGSPDGMGHQPLCGTEQTNMAPYRMVHIQCPLLISTSSPKPLMKLLSAH
jgi:hypothetical protein